MQTLMKIMLTTKAKDRLVVEEILRRFGVIEFPEELQRLQKEQVEFQNYKFVLPYDSGVFFNMKAELKSYGVREIVCAYEFKFSAEEYANSPLFYLIGVGNSADAYPNEKGTEFELEVVCQHCKILRRKQVSSLRFNTKVLAKRDLVLVDREFPVVSERLAEKMAAWELTGYELREVVHAGKGADRQPAFQLCSTTVLPDWRTETLEQHGVKKCPICGLRGKISYPFAYAQSTLAGHLNDVNRTSEEIVFGNRLLSPILFSAKFRRLVIEAGMTPDCRSAERSGKFDWYFEPVLLV